MEIDLRVRDVFSKRFQRDSIIPEISGQKFHLNFLFMNFSGYLLDHLEKISCFCSLENNTFKVLSEDKTKILYSVNLNQIANVIASLNKVEPEMKVIIVGGKCLKISGLSRSETQKWTILLLTDPEPVHSLNIDSFEIIQKISQGSTCSVFLALHKNDGKHFALKTIPKDENDAGCHGRRAISEKNILLRIRHPFIVQLYGCFQTDTHFYLVLDYIPGGNLRQLMLTQTLSSSQIALYIAEVSIALKHLHSMGFIFRDLKPENILIDSKGHIKLTDFGYAKEITQPLGDYSFCGTIEYAAPELISGSPYGPSIDWWALGIITYELLIGSRPFTGNTNLELSDKIISAELNIPHSIVPEERSLIVGLLKKDPNRRLGDNDILSEPFFNCLDNKVVTRGEANPEYIPPPKEITKNFDVNIDDPNLADIDDDMYVPGFSWQLDTQWISP